MKAAKPGVTRKQMDLLAERYDLANKPASGVTMTRGKAVQEGARAKLSVGVTWEALGTMTPDQIREKDAFPKGYLPLPHPNQPEGGMVFPKFLILEVQKQEQRDLTRFDLDYDLPKKGVNILERGSQVHFMAEFQELLDFPPAPKLGIDGKLDPKKASAEETRGQALFFGKAQCATCHQPPYYTDLTNIALGTNLSAQEKKDLLAFLRAL